MVCVIALPAPTFVSVFRGNVRVVAAREARGVAVLQNRGHQNRGSSTNIGVHVREFSGATREEEVDKYRDTAKQIRNLDLVRWLESYVGGGESTARARSLAPLEAHCVLLCKIWKLVWPGNTNQRKRGKTHS